MAPNEPAICMEKRSWHGFEKRKILASRTVVNIRVKPIKFAHVKRQEITAAVNIRLGSSLDGVVRQKCIKLFGVVHLKSTILLYCLYRFLPVVSKDNSLSVKSKLGLGYKDYTGPNEIYYPEMQSIFDPEEANDKTLYYQEHVRFVKEGGMNAVPPPITGIFMPSSNQPEH
ncbi:hypothetical protein Tco_1370677 [Tanacetum coccineum]